METPLGVETGEGAGGGGVQSSPLDAASLAVKHEGLKGGKGREDGLVPGSVEALKADRAKDAKRKRDARRAATAAGATGSPTEPPTLPSKVDAPQAASRPDDFVPWTADMLRPLTAQIADTLESYDVRTIVEHAQKIAGLPATLLAEIERDCTWNRTAKEGAVMSSAQILAGWLNKSGISSKNAPWLAFVTSTASIYLGRAVLIRRLDKWAKESQPQPTKPNESEPQN